MRFNFFPHPRPYWHVDAKWVAGLLFMAALVTTLFLNALVSLTQREPAIELSAAIIGGAFTRPEGEETAANPEDIEKVRQQIEASPDKVFRPFPLFPKVTITKNDIETLNSSQIKQKVFSQISTPIYDLGIEGAARQVTNDPDQIKKFKNDAFFISLFTKQTHEQFKQNRNTAVVATLVLLVALVYFSAGWGRLANPGLLLLFSSIPGSLLALLLAHPPKPDKGDSGPFGPLGGFLSPEVMKSLGEQIGRGYWIAAIVGLLLLVVAGIGKLITHRKLVIK